MGRREILGWVLVARVCIHACGELRNDWRGRGTHAQMRFGDLCVRRWMEACVRGCVCVCVCVCRTPLLIPRRGRSAEEAASQRPLGRSVRLYRCSSARGT